MKLRTSETSTQILEKRNANLFVLKKQFTTFAQNLILNIINKI